MEVSLLHRLFGDLAWKVAAELEYGGLNAEEVLRALRRERTLKFVNPGRPSKIKMYVELIQEAENEDRRKFWLEEAKKCLSPTSFWRLRKQLSSFYA